MATFPVNDQQQRGTLDFFWFYVLVLFLYRFLQMLLDLSENPGGKQASHNSVVITAAALLIATAGEVIQTTRIAN